MLRAVDGNTKRSRRCLDLDLEKCILQIVQINLTEEAFHLVWGRSAGPVCAWDHIQYCKSYDAVVQGE